MYAEVHISMVTNRCILRPTYVTKDNNEREYIKTQVEHRMIFCVLYKVYAPGAISEEETDEQIMHLPPDV